MLVMHSRNIFIDIAQVLHNMTKSPFTNGNPRDARLPCPPVHEVANVKAVVGSGLPELEPFLQRLGAPLDLQRHLALLVVVLVGGALLVHGKVAGHEGKDEAGCQREDAGPYRPVALAVVGHQPVLQCGFTGCCCVAAAELCAAACPAGCAGPVG